MAAHRARFTAPQLIAPQLIAPIAWTCLSTSGEIFRAGGPLRAARTAIRRVTAQMTRSSDRGTNWGSIL